MEIIATWTRTATPVLYAGKTQTIIVPVIFLMFIAETVN
jgi:hypothetical protein